MARQVNEELFMQVHELRKKGLSQSRIADIVGASDVRQIQRYCSKDWLEQRPKLLSLLETSDEPDSETLMGRASNRLEYLCTGGDHTWLYDERYEGWAYESELAPLFVPWKDGGGGYVIPRDKRTCWFCGHISYV